MKSLSIFSLNKPDTLKGTATRSVSDSARSGLISLAKSNPSWRALSTSVRHSPWGFARYSTGFTLIEILIAIAIMMVLLSMGLLVTMDSYKGYMFRSERAVIVSILGKARSRALSNINQTRWGVCYVNRSYVIFQGAVCQASAVYDTLPANPSVAVDSDFSSTFPIVVFSQLTATTTTATIVVQQSGRTSTININNEGQIDW